MEPEATSNAAAAAATPPRRGTKIGAFRGYYNCGKCGKPKKGHTCVFDAKCGQRKKALEDMKDTVESFVKATPSLDSPTKPRAPSRREWSKIEDDVRKKLNREGATDSKERALKDQLDEIKQKELENEDLRHRKYELERTRYQNSKQHQATLKGKVSMIVLDIQAVVLELKKN